MLRRTLACTFLALALAAPIARADDDGVGAPPATAPVSFEKDPMGLIAVKGDEVDLQVDTNYVIADGDAKAVLKNFPGASVMLYGKATKRDDTSYSLEVRSIYCPGGDVYDDPAVDATTPRGQVPRGEVILLDSAQDPATKTWW
jgi:hypothetical protein